VTRAAAAARPLTVAASSPTTLSMPYLFPPIDLSHPGVDALHFVIEPRLARIVEGQPLVERLLRSHRMGVAATGGAVAGWRADQPEAATRWRAAAGGVAVEALRADHPFAPGCCEAEHRGTCATISYRLLRPVRA